MPGCCFFSRLFFRSLISLLLAAASGQSDIRVLRRRARRHKSLRPQLRQDFISDPLCIWKARLAAGSELRPPRARYRQAGTAKNIYLHALPSAPRGPFAAFFHKHTKTSKAHFQRDLCFCEGFLKATQTFKRVTPVASSETLWKRRLKKKKRTFDRRDPAELGSDRRCEAERVGTTAALEERCHLFRNTI